MNDSVKSVLDELITILNRIRDNKVYGSVELFFENGEITQITQRIIRKVKQPPVKTEPSKKPLPRQNLKKDQANGSVSTLE